MGWQAIVDRWGVDVIVMAPGDVTIVALLEKDPGWRLAYRDTYRDGVRSQLGSLLGRADADQTGL